MINSILKEAKEFGAATCALQSTDTIKISDENGFIKSTLDRTNVWSVQTPQIFDVEIYRKALVKAKNDQISVTDDCMLLENAGYKIKLVNVGSDNIKITVKEDILMAEAVLIKRGEE